MTFLLSRVLVKTFSLYYARLFSYQAAWFRTLYKIKNKSTICFIHWWAMFPYMKLKADSFWKTNELISVSIAGYWYQIHKLKTEHHIIHSKFCFIEWYNAFLCDPLFQTEWRMVSRGIATIGNHMFFMMNTGLSNLCMQFVIVEHYGWKNKMSIILEYYLWKTWDYKDQSVYVIIHSLDKLR